MCCQTTSSRWWEKASPRIETRSGDFKWIVRASVDSFPRCQRLLASLARCHHSLCHLFRVLAGSGTDSDAGFVLFPVWCLMINQSNSFWRPLDMLLKCSSISAREKCDCESNAAVPSENLHQVIKGFHFWYMRSSRKGFSEITNSYSLGSDQRHQNEHTFT